MKILSHRGFWLEHDEKNGDAALRRSFLSGFGVETDIRDCCQQLVVSHDIPSGMEMSVDTLLSTASSLCPPNKKLTLALNIKADGLAPLLRRSLDTYNDLDCFVFDMSIPDMRSYFDENIPVFTRMSEVERSPAWIDKADGVWLDGFESDWFDKSLISEILDLNKRVCVVSPELHRRDHMGVWEGLIDLHNDDRIILCTDFPDQATKYFCDNGQR